MIQRTTSVRYDIGHNSNGLLVALAGRFLAVGLQRKSGDLATRQIGPLHIAWGRVRQKPTPLPLRLATPTTPVDSASPTPGAPAQ